MSKQWHHVKGEADRGKVSVDMDVLAESPEAATGEALYIAGALGWIGTPDVQVERDEVIDDEQ